MPTPRPDNMAVLVQRIAEPNANGCLLWLGAKSKKGYGSVQLDGRQVRVHRLVYEITADSIPVGHDVHHRCGERACVNTGHLEVVTHTEHARLHRGGERTHCPNGHPYDETNTYRTRSGVRQCRTCDRDRHKASYARARGLPLDLEAS